METPALQLKITRPSQRYRRGYASRSQVCVQRKTSSVHWLGTRASWRPRYGAWRRDWTKVEGEQDKEKRRPWLCARMHDHVPFEPFRDSRELSRARAHPYHWDIASKLYTTVEYRVDMYRKKMIRAPFFTFLCRFYYFSSGYLHEIGIDFFLTITRPRMQSLTESLWCNYRNIEKWKHITIVSASNTLY